MKDAAITDSCRLCAAINGTRVHGVADKPIIETANFVVIPSIGGFIEGWSMIVPKEHVYDMSSFYGSEEFITLVAAVYSRVEKAYGPLIMFEHGASYSGSPTGCGVDHAHFHFVPSPQSLSPALKASGRLWRYCEAKDIASISKAKDYLFYSDTSPITSKLAGHLHIVEEPVSQFFRRLLAELTNNQDSSDYRAHPFIENAHRTAQTLFTVA